MFERYKNYSPYDMLESIKKEVKGDLENAFLNLGKHVWWLSGTPWRALELTVDNCRQAQVGRAESCQGGLSQLEKRGLLWANSHAHWVITGLHIS